MPETKPYYRILQVDPAAEQEVITAAYRRLAQKYHPDSSKSPDAVRRMQEINEAYEILSDPLKRERYNLQLSAQQQKVHRQPANDGNGYQSSPEAGANSRWESERREYKRTKIDESTQRADQQLGRSFMVVYCVITVVLFRLAITRITSIWVILLIFILAGILTLPVVFKIDDLLRKQ